jgi:uncharacterized protein (PEP-CTERM system associated)
MLTCRLALPTVVATVALSAGFVQAAEWIPSLSISGMATATDNALLQPSGQAQSDVILSVTPTIGVRKEGARLKLRGSYSPSMFTYLAGSASSTVRNTLAGTASLEAVQNFLYVDARASINQTFLTPFGPQPGDLGTSTANRVETRSLGLTPYIRGRLRGGSTYLVRDDVLYTSFDRANQSDIFGHAASAQWNGVADRFIVPSAEYNLNSTQFGSQQPFVAQTARLRGTINLDPEIQLFVSGGYEHNDYVLSEQYGPIYGGGFVWKPSPRTNVRGNAEHRFFGNTFELDASYRTPLSAWVFRAGRRIQTSQQQILQAGNAGLRAAVDTLLSPTIPDPDERAAAVDRILASGNLGSLPLGPTPILAPRVLLVESYEPSIAFLGKRSTITFTAFWRKTTPLSEALTPSPLDPFGTLNTVTQTGGGIGLTHKFDPLLSGDINVLRVVSQGTPTATVTGDQKSWQSIFRANLTRQIDPKTFASVGFRWQVFNSSIFTDYRERAVLVNLTHIFF